MHACTCVCVCVCLPQTMRGVLKPALPSAMTQLDQEEGRGRETHREAQIQILGGGGQKTFSISIQLNSFCLCHKAKASCCYCFSENTVLYNSDHIYYEGSFLCGSEVSNLKQIETTDLFLISINKQCYCMSISSIRI